MRRDYKAELCQLLGFYVACGELPSYQAEYRPFTSRRWRIDLFWPAEVTARGIPVGLEYEGLTWSGGTSRHQTNTGATGDAEKYSWVAIAGICLIRVTAPMVVSGLAVRLVKAAVLGEWPKDGPVRRGS